MPILDNHKHERFAQALAQGMSADAAYQEAGYSANMGNASRLKGNEKVMKRVAELQASAADGAEITLQWLIKQAVGIVEDARNDKSHAAAVAALKEVGTLSGLRVERQTQEHEGGFSVEVRRTFVEPEPHA